MASSSLPFGFCLNTSTISGQKLPLLKNIQIAAKAGYHAIEPWIREMDEHVRTGGSLKDIAKALKDNGLTVESAIGFFEWIVDDEARRATGLEEARRNLEMLAQIGGKRLAAPPFGYHEREGLDLLKAAQRYRQLLELGDQFGVVPEVEFWGASKSLHTLGEATLIAMESGHPKACVLADVFHMYKGGSSPAGLRLLTGNAIHVLHLNDYPADPPRASITDADRVWPGDGVAPLGEIFRTLHAIGFRGYLSLELFNRTYWQQDALTCAKTGLAKMRDAVAAALA